jgi:hypothetical protein
VTLNLVRVRGFDVDPTKGLIYGARGLPVGSKTNRGYIRIEDRYRSGTRLLAHLLVWEAVHGPVPPGFEVNHKNGEKSDNRIDNLEIVTHQKNMLHAYATGLKSNRGDRHPGRKLSSSDVHVIRRLLRDGQTGASIARRYGVTPEAVYAIRNRKNWAHVGDDDGN